MYYVMKDLGDSSLQYLVVHVDNSTVHTSDWLDSINLWNSQFPYSKEYTSIDDLRETYRNRLITLVESEEPTTIITLQSNYPELLI